MDQNHLQECHQTNYSYSAHQCVQETQSDIFFKEMETDKKMETFFDFFEESKVQWMSLSLQFH